MYGFLKKFVDTKSIQFFKNEKNYLGAKIQKVCFSFFRAKSVKNSQKSAKK